MTSLVDHTFQLSLFLALLSPALVATLAGLETASLELNAHLRVQPAHCVYDFIFSRIFRPCLTVGLTSERVMPRGQVLYSAEGLASEADQGAFY